MATLSQQLAAIASDGVRYVPPRRTAQRPAIPAGRGVTRRRDEDSLTDRMIANSMQRSAAPRQNGPGVKDQAIHGLGWVIGNPVSQAVLKPLEVLSLPQLAGNAIVTELGAEAVEGLGKFWGPGADKQYPDLDTDFSFKDMLDNFRNKRGFGTTLVEPIMGADNEYHDPWNIWWRRGAGFLGDVATDPLMKLGGGTRAASGAEARFGYANKLLDAQQAARAEQAAAREAAESADMWARLGGTGAEEAQTATARAAEAAARRSQSLEQIGDKDALDLILRRGVNIAEPAQLEAMGLPRHAIRFAGEPIENIVRRFAGERAAGAVGGAGEEISQAMSRFLAPAKQGWSSTAGRLGRKAITPMGKLRQTLSPATERLMMGEGTMSREVALRTHAVNQTMRTAGGSIKAPAVEYLHRFADALGDYSDDEVASFVRTAEESGVENAVTDMAPQMIEVIKEAYRQAGLPEEMLDTIVPELKPWTLPNGAQSRYTMPHVLSRDAFRFFTKLRKGQNPLLDFIRRDMGIHDKDLLEEGGFLQRRLFRPNADGSPQTFKIGKDEIEITTGSVAELEEKLGGLLRSHGFQGKLYETNPVEAWRRYIGSIEKDVARNVALYKAKQYGLTGLRGNVELPKSWDPYGREFQMVPAEGETEPRYVRGRTTEQRPASTEEYEWVPDEEATAARNKIILEGGDKGPTQQVLNEYGETATATRENLAQGIENTRQYTKAAFEREQGRAAKQVSKMQKIVDERRAVVDDLETEYRELLKETSANEQLAATARGKIHGVRSVTPKRIKAAQAKRLADIARTLQAERDNLTALQRAMENALRLTDMAEQKAAVDRIEAIHQAVIDAQAGLTKEREAATRSVQRRVDREAKGGRDIHMVSEIEKLHADDLLARGPESPAALRAVELQERVAKHTANQAEHRAEALRLQEQADRLDERLDRLGYGGRTPEQRARLARSREEMEAEVKNLRRGANVAQNRANTSKRALREAEERLKNDEWMQAQRTVDMYDEQQQMIENYSDRLTDMKTAKSKLNAAVSDLNKLGDEQRMELEGVINDEHKAWMRQDRINQKAVERAQRRLDDAAGEETYVDYTSGQPQEFVGQPGAEGTHTLLVSGEGMGDIARITWKRDSGEVVHIFTEEQHRGQGVGIALYDYATAYAKQRGFVPPAGSDVMTDAGRGLWEAIQRRGPAVEPTMRETVRSMKEIFGGKEPVIKHTEMKNGKFEMVMWNGTRDVLSDELALVVDESDLDWVDSIYSMSNEDTKKVVSEYWDRLGPDAQERLTELGWQNGQPYMGTDPHEHLITIEYPSGMDAATLRWDGETGEVGMIWVDEDMQRAGLGTAIYDYARNYSERRGFAKPEHSPTQTRMGQAWAPDADRLIANTPKVPGLESQEGASARALLDSPEARTYRADETVRNELQAEIDQFQRAAAGEAPPAQWDEVGRKPSRKEPRANQRWRAYNSRRRKILGEMERIRSEADLTAPPTRAQFQAESTKAPKAPEPLPGYMEKYRRKPSGRRLRGQEPWWTEAEVYPSRPNLTSSKRSRNTRLRKLQDELETVDKWLGKHPRPPDPRPNPRAVKLRAKINGKTVRMERTSPVGALGGAEWKITLPDGTEQMFRGTMADALREGDRLGYSLGREAPDEAVLADLQDRLTRSEEWLASHDPELVQNIKASREMLGQLTREQADIPPTPIPKPTRAELIRAEREPAIEEARQRVARYGAIDARAETEGVGRTIQSQANEQIRGLQGEVESIEFQQQRLHSMIDDLYQNRMPDPVNDWRMALDNADQARAVHQQISDYIDQYATRQRALNIVNDNARRGAPTSADLKRVAAREMRPEDAQGLQSAVDDVNRWMQNAGQVLPVGVRNRIEAALMAHEQALAQLTTTNDLPASALAKIQREAQSGKLAPVLKAQLRDAWREVGPDNSVLIDKELERMMFGVEQALDSKLFGRLFTTWTNFFKTYATLTPGFHVRNALSAIFMNATEGVTFGEQRRAMQLWRQYRNSDDPLVFLRSLKPHERDAFRATFASGAGGQFIEGGVGEARAGASRFTERLFSNPATRLSKRGGEWVEGPQRLALGLHSTKAGGSVEEALSRITRIHFDYSQVSKFDENMKRLVPFWTFMSRNVPLQFTQMWMRPKMYLGYQHAMTNMQLGADQDTIIPSYITSAGGVDTGLRTPKWAEKIPVIGPPAGMPIVAQPDLPHTRYADDLQRVQNALSGQGLGQMATNLNPALTVPAEFVSRTDFFTGQTFDKTDRVKVGGAMLPYAMILSLGGYAGQGADGEWYVDAAALNAIRGLDPNLDRMMRLAPQLLGQEGTDKTGASTTARQAESWARWLGAPVRTISEQQQRSELRRRAFEERDQRQLQAAMGG